MQRLTTTPFGQRPVTAGLLAAQKAASARPALPSIDKWEIFRDLTTARVAFGLTDRDLTVLNALLSFLPDTVIADTGDMIVFPSNRALSDRAHGMAESTLRRHLAALVRAGVILRHDSPNGKRYAHRGSNGAITRAYGFDLAPLLARAKDITAHAAETRAMQAEMKQAREQAVLNLRDASKLMDYAIETGIGGNWDAIHDQMALARRALRRKLNRDDLSALAQDIRDILKDVTDRVSRSETKEMSGNDNENERHYHNSNKDSSDFEPCLEKQRGGAGDAPPAPSDKPQGHESKLPLMIVLKACPDLQDYVPDGIRHWHELVKAAAFLRGMLGISPHAWDQAVEHMGAETAAITVACMLQRADHINNPGGYLRALTAKARDAAFSPGPMVMALLNGANTKAA